MRRLYNSCKIRLYLLLLTAISLVGCSLQPPAKPNPQILSCPKPQISQQFWTLPAHQAVDQLSTYLGLPPMQLPSVAAHSSSLTGTQQK